MRISKYLPIFGAGLDVHMAMPPSIPPPPPAPNPAVVPANAYVVIIHNAFHKIFGKWSNDSVSTEGMGDILWQYDWGPTQVHIAVGPALLTPSQAFLLLGSSTKYWLPSFAIQEKIDGGALGGSGGCAVAVSWASCLIVTQDCQDINGFGFVAPTSVCYQMISTRWVGFHWGDFCAGAIGLLGDAANALIISYFGGKLVPGARWDNQLLGLFANQISSVLQAGGLPALFSVGGGAAISLAWLTSTPASAGMALGPLVAWGAGQLANKVGGNPRPGDWGYATP